MVIDLSTEVALIQALALCQEWLEMLPEENQPKTLIDVVKQALERATRI